MESRASRTAAQVALFRALETTRADRLFADPYAYRFLPAPYRAVVRAARLGLRAPLERYIDRRWSGGPRASAVVRTRLIDDLLTTALAGGGLGAVVLLGAGYDSRGYRLPTLAGVACFEVDHPATQASKRRLLGTAARTTMVAVDLSRDDLGAALTGAGFAVGTPTVVIWEGVTDYLTPESVDDTLRGLARLTGTGSRVIFTYVDRGALDGTVRFDGFDRWRAAVADGGEPWTFGWYPGELADYLAARDLRLDLDLSTSDAAARYLTPARRHEPTAAFYRIAQATVVSAAPGSPAPVSTVVGEG